AAVHLNLNALQVGPERPPADASHLAADAAQVLRLTAPGVMVAQHRFLAAHCTLHAHDLVRSSTVNSRPPGARATPEKNFSCLLEGPSIVVGSRLQTRLSRGPIGRARPRASAALAGAGVRSTAGPAPSPPDRVCAPPWPPPDP